MSAVTTTRTAAPGAQAPRPADAPSPHTSLALLEHTALAAVTGQVSQDLRRAAAQVRDELGNLHAMQSALTDALIASQDRLLAVEALARVNVGSADGDKVLDDLLDRALALTAASQVLLLDQGIVSATRGEPMREEHADLVQRVIAGSTTGVPLTSSSGSALIGTLDPDDGAHQHLAFLRTPDRPFTTADVPLVEAITSAVGVHLALARLHRRELAQAVIEREHQLASLLAQSVIRDEPPRSPTVQVFARTAPASLTGGDFYVFGRGEGLIWFAVGDVAGKGLPAAMLMTRAVAACRVAFLAHRLGSVTEVFARVEDELFDHLDDAGLFTTLALGTIDERTGQIHLVNAGHSPVLLVRDGTTGPLPASVPPLGIVRGRVPQVSTLSLAGDDRLVVGSDGLVDQADPTGELFGYDRLHEVCRSGHRRPVDALGDGLFETVSDFAAGSAASDDATLVVLSFDGGAAWS